MRTPPRLGKHQGFMVTSARRAGSQKPTEMPMRGRGSAQAHMGDAGFFVSGRPLGQIRSEEHTSELQSLMRISYAVFCLKKNTTTNNDKYKQRGNKQHKCK